MLAVKYQYKSRISIAILNEEKAKIFLEDIPETLSVRQRDRNHHLDYEHVEMEFVGKMNVDLNHKSFFDDPNLVKAIDIQLRTILRESLDLEEPNLSDLLLFDKNYRTTLPYGTDDEDEQAFEDYLNVCKAISDKLDSESLEKFLEEMYQYGWMDTLLERIKKF